MNRHEALQFIRDNSRCLREFPFDWTRENDITEVQKLEHRIGNDGTPFILIDMCQHGWEIYWISRGNNIDKSIAEFCQVTGAELP